jgi:nitroreductase/NAD-dependent dihydropyrimidine dehydrogenase PreA subunit
MSKIIIDQDQCKQDGLCATVCPVGVLEQTQAKTVPMIAHEGLCISCGHCIIVCPQKAIAHPDLPPERSHPILRENLPTPEQITQLMNTRRSIRSFKDAPIAKDVIAQIIAGACAAPSAHNTQSTEYVIVQDRTLLNRISQLTIAHFKTISSLLGNPILQPLALGLARDTVEEAVHLLPEFKLLIEAAEKGKDPVLHHAPALIVFHAKRGPTFAAENANLAAQNAALVAQSAGIGAFYTGYVIVACERDNRIAKLLAIPKAHQIYAALAIGYPAVRFTRWIEKDPPKIRWM